MNLSLFTMSICNIYEQQTVYVRYHSLYVCGIRFASSWLPNNLYLLPLKTEKGRTDKQHGTSVYRQQHRYRKIKAYAFRNYSMYPLCLRTLGEHVRDTSVTFVQHPLFPLCVCFEIVSDNLFGVVILFYPLLSAKLPILICLTSILHNTFVRSFPFCFRNFRSG